MIDKGSEYLDCLISRHIFESVILYGSCTYFYSSGSNSCNAFLVLSITITMYNHPYWHNGGLIVRLSKLCSELVIHSLKTLLMTMEVVMIQNFKATHKCRLKRRATHPFQNIIVIKHTSHYLLYCNSNSIFLC